MKESKKLKNSSEKIHVPFDFCMICGNEEEVALYDFEHSNEKQVEQIASLSGLPGADIISGKMLSRKLHITASFCKPCISKWNNKESYSFMFGLAFVTVIFFTIILTIFINRFAETLWVALVFSGGTCLAIGVLILWSFYTRRVAPRINILDDRAVVIRVAGKGRIVFNRN